MAVSKKLNKSENKEVSVEDLILKGGTSGGEQQQPDLSDDEIRRVQLRIPLSKLKEIDKAKKQRPGKLSRHTWIMEAIEEKLSRDLK